MPIDPGYYRSGSGGGGAISDSQLAGISEAVNGQRLIGQTVFFSSAYAAPDDIIAAALTYDAAGEVIAPLPDGWTRDPARARWTCRAYQFANPSLNFITPTYPALDDNPLVPVSEVWYPHHNAPDFDDEVRLRNLYINPDFEENFYSRLFDFGNPQHLLGAGTGDAAELSFAASNPDADLQPKEGNQRPAGNYYFHFPQGGKFGIDSAITVGTNGSTSSGVQQLLMRVESGTDDHTAGGAAGGYQSLRSGINAASGVFIKATAHMIVPPRDYLPAERLYINFSPYARPSTGPKSFTAIIKITKYR